MTGMTFKDRDFWMREIILSSSLPTATKVVAFGVALNVNVEMGSTFPLSFSALSKKTGIDRSNVWRHVKLLVEGGWLESSSCGDQQKARQYRLYAPYDNSDCHDDSGVVTATTATTATTGCCSDDNRSVSQQQQGVVSPHEVPETFQDLVDQQATLQAYLQAPSKRSERAGFVEKEDLEIGSLSGTQTTALQGEPPNGSPMEETDGRSSFPLKATKVEGPKERAQEIKSPKEKKQLEKEEIRFQSFMDWAAFRLDAARYPSDRPSVVSADVLISPELVREWMGRGADLNLIQSAINHALTPRPDGMPLGMSDLEEGVTGFLATRQKCEAINHAPV